MYNLERCLTLHICETILNFDFRKVLTLFVNNDEISRTAVFDFVSLQGLLNASRIVWENYLFRIFLILCLPSH